ncbi:transposase [Celerinatantimonas sp. MCCC 1A17872]|uniref:transposase n=1 Tax=Celerinatantimonas sp. MCCC 1A17872 TaxID=3177514 RepID=UPI0038BF1ACF
MAKPRSQQISVRDTPYYHCVSRCVRKAFLCGVDAATGQNYEHRRGWIEERLLQLADIFAIDICAYAIMSNHVHIVFHINPQIAQKLTPLEVIERWHRLHQGTFATQRYVCDEHLSEFMQKLAVKTAETYRQRLQNISWFMKELNESIARRANEEDHCTGRFWEGRFKSQALLDEAALAACMAYVDLNPVRAKMSQTPESSEYTSIKKRADAAHQNHQPRQLYPFIGNPTNNMPDGLPFKFTHYLELVDYTGRVIRPDKRGSLDLSLQPILRRLGLNSQDWIDRVTAFDGRALSVIGEDESLKRYSVSHRRQRQLRNHFHHQ